jgi:hypothetical protein
MVFEFKVRGISKENRQKLFKKYVRKFKQKTNIEVVSTLFLDLIYLYFDNEQEKLYKLFFPIIMANFQENGSIHSVIQEHSEENNLYSWSYTYRIINTLDEDSSLKISRLSRDILFKILKKIGFRNKGLCVSIDETVKPFYGNKDLFMVRGCKRKSGTNYGIQYLTACIVEEGVRFNLLCYPLSSLGLTAKKFQEFISEIRRMVPIRLLSLDRGFGNKKYCKILKLLRHKFIMPITRNNKLKELEKCVEVQLGSKKEDYDIVPMTYIFNENRAKEYQLNLKLIILNDKNGVFFFITNIYNLTKEEYYALIQVYRYRFGIETNYRVDNIFSPLSSSVNPTLRYLYMQVSLLAQDLWTLVNFLQQKEERKQPREEFKGNYSIVDIIKARARKLSFIWRPVISAVSFKRRVMKILT